MVSYNDFQKLDLKTAKILEAEKIDGSEKLLKMMKISVKVKLKAKQEKCEKTGENSFTVFVKEAPIEGRANEAVVKILAKYFDVSKSQVKIISGLKSRQKIVEIS